LTYVSDGDTNGLFYWLGTNLGTTAWSNPAGSSQLGLIASTSEFGTANMLSERAPSNFYTNNLPNQWIAWALDAARTISVDKYTLRNRNFDTNHLPRNWVLEGANTISNFDIAGINAATWTAIDTKVNDATLTTIDQYYTIAPNGSNAAYRYIRLRQSGTNSNGANYFTVNELELYGVFG
jgi:E3 ubiquitin-protein ligase HECTD1